MTNERFNFAAPAAPPVKTGCSNCRGIGFTVPSDPNWTEIGALKQYRVGVPCSCKAGLEFAREQVVEQVRERNEDIHVSGQHEGYRVAFESTVGYAGHECFQATWAVFERLICSCGWNSGWYAVGNTLRALARSIAERA